MMASNDITVTVHLEASEALKAFIRTEVRTALDEELQHVLRQAGIARVSCPARLETDVVAPPRAGDNLPSWAAPGPRPEGTAH